MDENVPSPRPVTNWGRDSRALIRFRVASCSSEFRSADVSPRLVSTIIIVGTIAYERIEFKEEASSKSSSTHGKLGDRVIDDVECIVVQEIEGDFNDQC